MFHSLSYRLFYEVIFDVCYMTWMRSWRINECGRCATMMIKQPLRQPDAGSGQRQLEHMRLQNHSYEINVWNGFLLNAILCGAETWGSTIRDGKSGSKLESLQHAGKLTFSHRVLCGMLCSIVYQFFHPYVILKMRFRRFLLATLSVR